MKKKFYMVFLNFVLHYKSTLIMKYYRSFL